MPLGASWTLLGSRLEPLGRHWWLLRILLGISWDGLGRPWTSYGITWASLWAPLGSWGISYLILLQADLRQFGVWKRLCDGFGSIVSELMLLGAPPAAQPGLSSEPRVPFAAAPPRPTASVPLWYP